MFKFAIRIENGLFLIGNAARGEKVLSSTISFEKVEHDAAALCFGLDSTRLKWTEESVHQVKQPQRDQMVK